MEWYRTYLFPWCLDFAMSRPAFMAQRPRVLAEVREPVLEIGFGTGQNLTFYPSHIRELYIIEPNPGMMPILRRRLRNSPIRVRPASLLNGRGLPFADCSFESIVCTWTLCSIAEVAFALNEIHRVLRPGGHFHFIEHGLSPEPKVARWQHRLNPLQMIVGDGCHLNRPIADLVHELPFQWEVDERLYLPGLPKIVAYHYRGIVCKVPSA
jgi:SAM-dependent methyltransferase